MPRRRDWRRTVTADLARAQAGVASRAQLRQLGITRFDVRTEIEAGRWASAGRSTVLIRSAAPDPSGFTSRADDTSVMRRRWTAVLEAGPGARLDGVTALQQAGLTGWEHATIEISVPHSNRAHRVPGARVRRRRHLEPPIGAGIPRTRPDIAVIRAAASAASERQAATLVAMTAQQRLTSTSRLRGAWRSTGRIERRAFLEQIVADVCDGAHSLGELDFARLCRRYGLPTPDRQAVVHTESGRLYLDVRWTDLWVVVEIEGAHHFAGASPVDDSLRQNSLTIGDHDVLRIPVLGLRCEEREFMTQVGQMVMKAQSRRLGDTA